MAATSSGIGRMFVTWKYWAYFLTLFLWWSSGDFFLVAQETSIARLSGGFCHGRIGLAGSEVSLVLCEAVSDGHSNDMEGFACGS